MAVIAVHGGAGVWRERLADANAACDTAAEIGHTLLMEGGSALDAVEAAVRTLEDHPLLNAGTGGALNHKGELELDASIMDGMELRAGAVAALPPFANPISVARAVMHEGRHVLYAGEGAADFARGAGFEPAEEGSMVTDRARRRLAGSDGTVGAVALDAHGRLAAATSTGGRNGQRAGRVGDTPLIGAGTYADEVRAASATGQGEAIMRAVLSYWAVSVPADRPAQTTAAQAIERLESRYRGRGGLILVDRGGGVGISFNTQAMANAVRR